MNIAKMLPLIVVLLLAACGGKNDTEIESVDPAASNTSAELEVPIDAGPSALPVAGGVTVAFPHVIASRSDESNADGSLNHVLRVVYQEVEAAQVALELAEGFRKIGLRAMESNTDGSKLTYVASDGATRVRYVIIPVGPDLGIELSQNNAKGLVTFYWKE